MGAESTCPAVEKPVIFISLSLPDASLFSFILQQLLTLLFISHTQWLITAIYTLLLLCNSVTMATTLFNLHSTGHSSVYTCSSVKKEYQQDAIIQMIYCCCSSSNLHSAHTLNVAPQYCNLPHPTLPANNPICSNTWSFLLMMGIKMPKTCRDCSQ